MSSGYQKSWEKYEALAKRAAQGDRSAMAEKAEVFTKEIRPIEREAARAGTILDSGKDITADVTRRNGGVEPSPKRDLQRDYLRSFDGETEVMIPAKAGDDPEPTKLRLWHKKRLKI